MPAAIDHIEIGVTNLDRSRRFYIDLLELRPTQSSAQELWLDGGGGRVHLVEISDPKPSGWSPNDLQRGIRHVGFKVDDVDAHVERLRQAGEPIAVEPFDTMADVRIAFFPDPDGARLEFVTGAHVYHRLLSHELSAAEREGLPKPGDPPRLDHVAITVADLDRALAHYRDELGMEPIGQLFQRDERGFTITDVQSAGAVLELFSFDVPTTENPWTPDPARLGFRAIGLADGSALSLGP
jgi:catechol 2,3-dioxygenase-like lactoylglutathione lyase family enzyme